MLPGSEDGEGRERAGRGEGEGRERGGRGERRSIYSVFCILLCCVYICDVV